MIIHNYFLKYSSTKIVFGNGNKSVFGVSANVKAHLPPGGAHNSYLIEIDYFQKFAADLRRRRSGGAKVSLHHNKFTNVFII